MAEREPTDWRPAPTAAQVEAHASAHGSGMIPVVPGPVPRMDWRKAPKVPTGLWMIRKRQPKRGREFRAAHGYIDPPVAHPSLRPLGAWDGRVWFGVMQLTNDLMDTAWMAGCECRPVDWEGHSVPWPGDG